MILGSDEDERDISVNRGGKGREEAAMGSVGKVLKKSAAESKY